MLRFVCFLCCLAMVSVVAVAMPEVAELAHEAAELDSLSPGSDVQDNLAEALASDPVAKDSPPHPFGGAFGGAPQQAKEARMPMGFDSADLDAALMQTPGEKEEAAPFSGAEIQEADLADTSEASNPAGDATLAAAISGSSAQRRRAASAAADTAFDSPMAAMSDKEMDVMDDHVNAPMPNAAPITPTGTTKAAPIEVPKTDHEVQSLLDRIEADVNSKTKAKAMQEF